MKVLILAAGFGTRLYPLTKDIPKPLLKIGKRYLIDYILEKFEKIKNIDEILIITNQKFYKDFLDWAKEKDERIDILNDGIDNFEARLGAIGDIQFAIEKAKIFEDLLVIGGDTLLEEDLNGFLGFAKSKRPFVSVGLYHWKGEKEAIKRYSVVKVNRDSKIVCYKEKPKKAISKLVGICLYFFPKERLGLIERYLNLKNTKKACLSADRDAPGNYISWLYKRIPIYGFEFRGLWFDIGSPDTYKMAKEAINKSSQ